MIIRNILPARFLILIFLPSHNQQIDSLRTLLGRGTGFYSADILFELSDNYVEVDENMALRYGLEGYPLALTLNDSSSIVFGSDFNGKKNLLYS